MPNTQKDKSFDCILIITTVIHFIYLLNFLFWKASNL